MSGDLFQEAAEVLALRVIREGGPAVSVDAIRRRANDQAKALYAPRL